MGRGHTRNLAVKMAKYPMLLCCDATNGLEADFVLKSIEYFKNEKGLLQYPEDLLIKLAHVPKIDGGHDIYLKRRCNFFTSPESTNLLITYGTLMRKMQSLKLAIQL